MSDVPRVGSDTGGTFTDLVTSDGRSLKVPSTPQDPGEAVRRGLAELLDGVAPAVLAHGTTVATNALLERSGATVALVASAGFADTIEIAIFLARVKGRRTVITGIRHPILVGIYIHAQEAQHATHGVADIEVVRVGGIGHVAVTVVDGKTFTVRR